MALSSLEKISSTKVTWVSQLCINITQNVSNLILFTCSKMTYLVQITFFLSTLSASSVQTETHACRPACIVSLSTTSQAYMGQNMPGTRTLQVAIDLDSE